MKSLSLSNLVCLILLHNIGQTWTFENYGEDFQDEVHEMTSQRNVLEFIRQTLDKLRTLSAGPRSSGIVFEVQRSSMNHVLTPVNPIVYDVIRVNKGNGYSPDSGKFTAPQGGLYFFSFSSLPGRGMKTDVSLMKNGEGVSLIHSVLAGNSSQLSMRNIILRLCKGDQVWVRLASGNLWSEGGSLSFQGFLLSE